MKTLKLVCPHLPKKFLMHFSCQKTGNYSVELCQKCHETESKEHLINEEKLQ